MTRWIIGALVLVFAGLIWLRFYQEQGHGVAPEDLTKLGDPSAHEILPEIVVPPGAWPWWRGPKHDNVCAAKNVPTRWSETENVLWKVPVPGRGHSTPIVWKDSIYLTTADEKKEEQILLALDRDSGTPRWQKVLHQGGFMKTNKKNSQASATPACDGERIFTTFVHSDGLWIAATDLAGNQVWETRAGPFRPDHGFGSSPILHKSLVIVNGDNDAGSYVVALHRKSGAVVWRTARPNPSNYATSVIARIAGKDQLLLHGGDRICGYDPDTGKLLWSTDGPTQICANTVAFHEDRVFASGGFPDKRLLCVRAGSGQMSKGEQLWEVRKGSSYVPSPLVYQGHLYLVNDDGVANCFHIDSGKVLGKARLDGPFSASLVAADGHLFIPNEHGVTFVFAATPKLPQVAANTLPEGCMASPVIVDGRIVLRTSSYLYCIGLVSAAAK